MTASTHSDPIATLAERQTWITPKASHAAQDAIRQAFEALGPQAQSVRDALHGTWLHEPLHAVLTDMPLGAWTAAILFDAIGAISGSRAMDKAADATVLFGLVTAAGAAITGINDWAEIRKDTPRRIGAVHALLNIGATALFTGILLCTPFPRHPLYRARPRRNRLRRRLRIRAPGRQPGL